MFCHVEFYYVFCPIDVFICVTFMSFLVWCICVTFKTVFFYGGVFMSP